MAVLVILKQLAAYYSVAQKERSGVNEDRSRVECRTMV